MVGIMVPLVVDHWGTLGGTTGVFCDKVPLESGYLNGHLRSVPKYITCFIKLKDLSLNLESF